MQGWLAACLGAVETLVFPWSCEVCGAEGQSSPFCPDCRAEFIRSPVSRCPRCALPVGPFGRIDRGCGHCRGRALGFQRAIALGAYEGAIRDLCLRMKREPNAWLARWVADLLVEARGESLRDEGEAVVAPVPLHWWRRCRRGYNQAEALASRLASRLDLPLIRPLRRVVSTERLAGLGRAERARRMRGVFRARRRGTFMGRTVLLVDDILTTGATCGAAARALRRAGAGRVVAVVIARAEGFS